MQHIYSKGLRMQGHTRILLLAAASLTLSACSGGSGDDTTVPGGGSDNSAFPPDDAVVNQPVFSEATAPEGTITHYGAVTVGDDAGMIADMVGGFFRLERGTSAEFLLSQFDGTTGRCQVQSDDVIDFEEISAGFIPTVPGVNKTSVSAGESVVLTSPGGTYATLAEQPGAGFLLYDLPNMQMFMAGPVPDGLSVDVPGSGEFPAFSQVQVPEVTTLTGVDIGDAEGISASTRFSWDAADDPSGMIRIFATTAGGFFLEDGVTVTCTVPDTGSFTFPSTTQVELGSDFKGGAPLISRIVVNPVVSENSLLYVIRESFE